jgi:cytidylate kinase
MREMAAERGISVLELSRIAEHDPSIDDEIDARSARLGAGDESLVIDSRLAWHFIPASIKVFLDVALEVAAERIYGARRGSEQENVDLDATRRSTEERAHSEALRYQSYYGIDYLDSSNYDLVIDTSRREVDDVVGEIVRYITAGRRPGAPGERGA